MPQNKNVANPQPLPTPLQLEPIPENNSVAGVVTPRTPRNDSISMLQDASDVGGSAVNELMYGAQDDEEQEQSPHAKKPTRTFCNKRLQLFSLFLFLLLAGIGVGIHFIVEAIDETDDDASKNNLRSVPTVTPTYPTFDDFIVNDDDQNSAPQTYSEAQIQAIDNVLIRLSAESKSSITTNTETIDLNDTSTPHGNCRFWLTQSDKIDLGLDENGQVLDAERIQQRYILCLFFEQMSGQNWLLGNGTFKDKTAHECTWEGVTCNGMDYVAVLDLWNKNLVGSIPQEITSLEKLKVLRLPNNTLVGSIPEKLLDLPELLWLDLSNNQLTGSVLSSTASQSSLLTLYLSYNKLQGTIPYFPQLTSLRLHGNKFTELNELYATSEPLQRLVAYNNDFEGTLPQIWNTPNLMHLDLGLNPWKGTIPSSLWENTPKLEYLLLNGGLLQGNLPTTTASTSLSYVWLQSNQLTGTIPETFGQNWFNLTSLQLQGNALQGSILSQCSQWQPTSQVIAADCDLVSCSCCTMCL